MNNKGFVHLLLIFILLGVIGFGIVLISKNSNTNNTLTTSQTETENQEIGLRELTYEEANSFKTPYSVSVNGGGPLVINPGTQNTVSITTENTGEEKITIDFELSDGDKSWIDLSSVPETLSLNSEKQQSFKINFSVPESARAGDTQRVYIRAIPRENPNMADSAELELTVGPKAWFEYTKNTDSNPLKVVLENISIGEADSWEWNFGDGTTSTEKNPSSHTYQTASTYTITLTAKSAHGNHTHSRDIWFTQ